MHRRLGQDGIVVPSGVPSISQTAKAQIKLMQGTYSSAGEILDFTFYDTQRINTTITEHRFFVNGIGEPFSDSSGNKTFADTNIVTKGIGNAQNFEVKAIKFIYKPDELRTEAELVNILDLLQETTFVFKVGNKDNSLELNLFDLMGANFAIPIAAAAVGIHTIRSTIRAAYPLNVSIPLAALTKYEGIVKHHVTPAAGLVGDKMQISLQGIYQRLS